ncbi:hypothetical protein [Bradyrhizobium cenepequi]|uniref:hypothetical protein n=1 Tax=Bradyrhizobium cenepequi TaxID=2821403 RepID=UPI001CE24D1C|nr:hypothetical protein [Bradyrhizobium cenepequi]MCA6110867.1 hypothetical protein [Bradyrhizobium cenepequi]
MEIIVVVLPAGVAGYFFLKHSTKRGTDTVRAYLYLRAISGGASVEEANEIAGGDVVSGSTQTIRNAQEHVRIAYGGKQPPMIAEAKRRGLVSF